MLGFIPVAVRSAIRIAPTVARTVAVQVARSPITRDIGIAAGVGLAASIASKQGADTSAQRMAEDAYKTWRPTDYVRDQRNVSGVRNRVKRNLQSAGQGVTEFGREWRAIVAPVFVGVETLRLKSAKRSRARCSAKVAAEPAKPKWLFRLQKANARITKRQIRLEKYESWTRPERRTRGEDYLWSVIKDMQGNLQSPVRAQTPEEFHFITLNNKVKFADAPIDWTKPYQTGQGLYAVIREAFQDKQEFNALYPTVVHAWLKSYRPEMSDRTWMKIRKGWNAAAQTFDPTKREDLHDLIQENRDQTNTVADDTVKEGVSA